MLTPCVFFAAPFRLSAADEELMNALRESYDELSHLDMSAEWDTRLKSGEPRYHNATIKAIRHPNMLRPTLVWLSNVLTAMFMHFCVANGTKALVNKMVRRIIIMLASFENLNWPRVHFQLEGVHAFIAWLMCSHLLLRMKQFLHIQPCGVYLLILQLITSCVLMRDYVSMILNKIKNTVAHNVQDQSSHTPLSEQTIVWGEFLSCLNQGVAPTTECAC